MLTRSDTGAAVAVLRWGADQAMADRPIELRREPVGGQALIDRPRGLPGSIAGRNAGERR